MLAPIGAQLVQRKVVPPRLMLGTAVTVVGLSFLHFSGSNLQTDYRHYAVARAYQGLGYGFFFVPLTMLAYSELRPDQNNRASSLTNFFRNWGGSFGIALATTLAERRQNSHQERVGATIAASSGQLQQTVQSIAAYLQSHGIGQANVMSAAYGQLYRELQQQTQLLALMDCFRVIGVVTLLALPVLLLTRSFKVGGGTTGAH